MGVYSGDSTNFTTSADIPDDGDPADAASVNVGLEAALDGLACLEARVLTYLAPGGAVGSYGSKVSMQYPLHNASSRFSNIGWAGGWSQSDATDAGGLMFEIVPPHVMASLDAVYVRCRGGSGNPALPGTMPKFYLGQSEDGAVSYDAGTSDPAMSRVAYDAWHTVALVGLGNDPLGVGERLVIKIEGEDGANKSTGFQVGDIICTWTDTATI